MVNLDNRIYYLNIGYDYGFYLMDYLDSKNMLKKYKKISNNNLIEKIENNYDNIDHDLVKANIITIYVDNDVDFDKLDKLIKKITKERVIYISKKDLKKYRVKYIKDHGYKDIYNNKIIGDKLVEFVINKDKY